MDALAVPLDILYEDNHLLVVNKPAGLATIGVDEHSTSLAKIAKDYLKRKYQKPGNVYLGVVSRLDRPVSGVVVLARTSKAAARLTEQFRERVPAKVYWAIVERPPEPAEGHCRDWLAHDESARKMVLSVPQAKAARVAELDYRTLGQCKDGRTWLEVRLKTGRKHQIRLQLSARGWPVVGDQKYGAHSSFSPGIALHARRLVVEHPTRGVALSFEAPPPPSWPNLA